MAMPKADHITSIVGKMPFAGTFHGRYNFRRGLEAVQNGDAQQARHHATDLRRGVRDHGLTALIGAGCAAGQGVLAVAESTPALHVAAGVYCGGVAMATAAVAHTERKLARYIEQRTTDIQLPDTYREPLITPTPEEKPTWLQVYTTLGASALFFVSIVGPTAYDTLQRLGKL